MTATYYGKRLRTKMWRCRSDWSEKIIKGLFVDAVYRSVCRALRQWSCKCEHSLLAVLAQKTESVTNLQGNKSKSNEQKTSNNGDHQTTEENNRSQKLRGSYVMTIARPFSTRFLLRRVAPYWGNDSTSLPPQYQLAISLLQLNQTSLNWTTLRRWTLRHCAEYLWTMTTKIHDVGK